MKESFVNSSLDLILKYHEYDEIGIKKLKYGLEGMYSMVTKFSVILIISFILGITKELLVLLLFYIGLRTFSFGFHAKTNIGCWISSTVIYTGIPLAIKYISLNNYVVYSIYIFSFISFILFAPADTKKRPLIRKNMRIRCKILTLIITILYLVILVFTNNELITNSITLALLLQAVLINPVFYYINKAPYNNYKKFNKV